MGVVPASVIATALKENRITVYSALQAMCKENVAIEQTKNKLADMNERGCPLN